VQTRRLLTHGARQILRWIGRRRRLAIWYHRSFRLPFATSMLRVRGGGHMDAQRADHVLTWLLDHRLVARDDVMVAPEASARDLRLVHDDDWLASLDEPETVSRVVGYDGPVPVDSMVELWRRGVGAAIEASEWVLRNDGVAATLMGGFHHAGPARGGGFCGLNDIAVAIGARRAAGFVGPIVVIDFDAHPPDGLAAFLLEDVEIRSVSADSSWTAGGIEEIRVPMQASDREYLKAVDTALRFRRRPGLAFYLAGSDPLSGDPLGALDVSPEALRERDRRVFAALEGIPTVVVPGGGYQRRSWAIYAGTLAQAIGSRQVVAPDYDPVARRVGRIARSMPDPAPTELTITEADLGMALRPAETVDERFLGKYTRHGVELALETYGLQDSLRRMGFTDVEIDIRTGPLPHRLRVLGSWSGGRDVLVEMSLGFREVGDEPKWRTLFVEWTEMRDPRYPFDRGSTRRRPLPGQTHAGLGIAEEVGSVLIATANRLHLDGVSYIPSHYHVAWLARSRMRFVDPRAHGRFRALCRYFEGVSLSQASYAMEAGLPTEEGDTIQWTPELMVHAIDPGLLRWLLSREDEVRAYERGTLDRLLPVKLVTDRPG
jgi:acetoin utilization deacetylase AcuC-like enzyme